MFSVFLFLFAWVAWEGKVRIPNAPTPLHECRALRSPFRSLIWQGSYVSMYVHEIVFFIWAFNLFLQARPI